MEKPYKILAINGSQRMEKGISQVLLETFLKGSEAGGAEWEILHPANMSINACRACYHCIVKKPGHCFQKDDMEGVLRRIQDADLLLVACPAYFDTMPGDMKRLIDRLMPFLGPNFEFRDGRTYHLTTNNFIKDVATILLCGNPERESMKSLQGTFRRIVKNMEGTLKGEFLFPSSQMVVGHPDELEAQLGALKKAGEEIVKRGAFSQQTLESANQEYIFDYAADIAAKNKAFQMMMQQNGL